MKKYHSTLCWYKQLKYRTLDVVLYNEKFTFMNQKLVVLCLKLLDLDTCDRAQVYL